MKKIFLTLVAAFSTLALFAGEPGSEALGFARVNNDPATAAMAGANIASTGNVAFAALGNIAMVPYSDKKFDATASYGMWAPGTVKGSSANLGIAGHVGNFAIAAAGSYGMYPKVDDNKPYDMLFGLGLSYKILNILSIGVNAKYASQCFTTVNRSKKDVMSGFMADVFVGGRWLGISATVGIANIGGKAVHKRGGIAMPDGRYALPSSVRAGVGYVNSFGKSTIDVQLDADYYLSGAFSAAIGAQYGVSDMFFLRAGYRYGGKTIIPSYATVGVGLKAGGFKVEGYYLFANDFLKNSFGVGIGYAF